MVRTGEGKRRGREGKEGAAVEGRLKGKRGRKEEGKKCIEGQGRGGEEKRRGDSACVMAH